MFDAAIVAIGDELVLGQTVDTNTAWVCQRLASRGIMAKLHLTVPDDRAMIRDAFAQGARTAPWVIVTGGLGPTEDDLTRFAFADALGVELAEDPQAMAHLQTWYAGRGKTMPQTNLVQAMLPAGTTVLPNPVGTAVGMQGSLGGSRVFVMPGVPRELHAIFEESVQPLIDAATAGHFLLTRKINTFGLGESTVAGVLGDLMRRDANPTIGTTVSGGVVSIRLRAETEDRAQAEAMLDDAEAAVRERMGAFVFGVDSELLQEAAVRLLGDKSITVATAESCTGGKVAAALTDVAGSSAVYPGGWVTYANEQKAANLGVDAALIEAEGAVSHAVACAMAEGARREAGVDLAISTTGIAGPSGGTDTKPVGTVWFGLADVGGSRAWHAHLRGNRTMVRDRARMIALQIVRFAALGDDPAGIEWLSEAVPEGV
ncbi:competence/damage-inducible protein A [Mucisphaera calidilacus]|uniref:CinA-like protein n=1 Tax=Mucisphaera calidilacus TaxID=2527982 RepID=A0A518BWF1_9BACT|nr:competence/damage-inducible protein A [Mucisphaera calidilacus]QDU71312.1 Nicotinamide-nucleotide amidohydrolase PncC [Mucisphaera calidilacus]